MPIHFFKKKRTLLMYTGKQIFCLQFFSVLKLCFNSVCISTCQYSLMPVVQEQFVTKDSLRQGTSGTKSFIQMSCVITQQHLCTLLSRKPTCLPKHKFITSVRKIAMHICQILKNCTESESKD